MKEYKVKGLTCANCTKELEEQIQKLEAGITATLNYNSGKLRIDERVVLADVKRILRSEGACLTESASLRGSNLNYRNGQGHESSKEDQGHGHHHAHQDGAPGHTSEHNDEHTHEHSHGSSRGILYLLGTSALLFGIGIILESYSSQTPAIVLYLLAIALSGYSTFIKGLRNLARFKFNIDTLMTIALIGAVGIGDWKEATLVAVLFGLNELLEGYGMDKARKSLEALLHIAPKEALIIKDGKQAVIPVAELEASDLVLVRPGDMIPSDGIVEDGTSSVNEAAITGEALPVEKAPGEPVFGGSVNNEGPLKIRIGKAYEDSSLAKILHLVEEAQESKTPTELFINRFAKYYTPAVILISLLVMLIPPLLGGSWMAWFYQGLAVLIVGCPCALILSSPVAIVAGITRNAKNGILVKGGVHLEQLGRINTIAFDKTGTLTRGEPIVEREIVYDDERFHVVSASIEQASSHPLAKAVMNWITSGADDSYPAADNVQAVSGQGIQASVDGRSYLLGSEKIIETVPVSEQVQSDIRSLKDQGLTLVVLCDENKALGLFGISDEIRPESRAVLSRLHRGGIQRTVMLTGDHEKTAQKVAGSIGVSEYFSSLLPEQKVNIIKKLTKEGRVAMVGDGINDAPALAAADLGIAMGKGTDSAIETADVVLMQDHLNKLPQAISIARRVNTTIKLNLGLALGLKIVALLLTIPGWLTLWIAILSDMGATIIVTLLSLTIMMQRPNDQRL